MFVLPVVGMGLGVAGHVVKGMGLTGTAAAAALHARDVYGKRELRKLLKQTQKAHKLAEAELMSLLSDTTCARDASERASRQHLARVEALKAEVATLTRANTALEAKLQEADGELCHRTSQLEASEAAVAEARAECARLHETTGKLHLEVARLSANEATSQATIQGLRDKFDESQAQCGLVVRGLQAEYRALEAKMRQEEAARKAAEEGLSKLTADRQAWRDACVNMLKNLAPVNLKARRSSSDTCSTEGSSRRSSQASAEQRYSTTESCADAADPSTSTTTSLLATTSPGSSPPDSTGSESDNPTCVCGQPHCRTCANRAADRAALLSIEDELDGVVRDTADIFGSTTGEETSPVHSFTSSGRSNLGIDMHRVVEVNSFMDLRGLDPTGACLAPLFNGGGSTGVTVEAVLQAQNHIKQATAHFSALTKRSAGVFVGAVKQLAIKSRGAGEGVEETASAMGRLLAGANGSVCEWWGSDALVAVGAVWAVGGPLMQPSVMKMLLESLVALREHFDERDVKQLAALYEAGCMLGAKVLA